MRVIPGVKSVEFNFNIMIVEYDDEIVKAEKIIEKATSGSSRAPEVI